MSRNVLAVVAVTVISFASWAAAANEKTLSADKQAKVLERHPGADTNKDGVLTKDEIRAAMANAHGPGEAAGGGGGALSILVPVEPAEILQADPQADTDGDGKLNTAERKAFMESQRLVLEKELLTAHPELDANRDGTLGPDEMRGARAAMEEFVTSKLMAAHPEADTDGDGRISRDEIKAFQMNRAASSGSPVLHVGWLIANFQKLDTDGNGQLTMAELQQFQQMASPKPSKPYKDKSAKTGEGRKNHDKKDRKATPPPAQ